MVKKRISAADRKVALGVSVKHSHLQRLDRLSKHTGLTRSQLVQTGIRILLDELSPEEVKTLSGLNVW